MGNSWSFVFYFIHAPLMRFNGFNECSDLTDNLIILIRSIRLIVAQQHVFYQGFQGLFFINIVLRTMIYKIKRIIMI